MLCKLYRNLPCNLLVSPSHQNGLTLSEGGGFKMLIFRCFCKVPRRPITDPDTSENNPGITLQRQPNHKLSTFPLFTKHINHSIMH
jgi:hypothetical protein